MEMELDSKIQEIAGRIRVLRELENITPEEMAKAVDLSVEEYLESESGQYDLNFTFIYRCSLALKVSVTDILEGYSPNLRSYTLTRQGGGQKISRAHGMTYYNLAYAFQNRIAEPLYVRSVYDEAAQDRPIDLTKHDGQECDIIVEGSLKVQIGEHSEILGPGDSIYYDSSTPHGMIAVGGQDCIFYAIVLNPAGEPIPELTQQPIIEEETVVKTVDDSERIWHDYIDVVENEKGTPVSIKFKNANRFNFAFDLVDALAAREPDKLAMLHISKDGTERRITFENVRKESARCANYFKALGIEKGDRVMLILKRHYQFWYALVGLNKLGAIAIPATNQLLDHDLEYRIRTAGITTVICTADGDTAHQVEMAQEKCGLLKNMLIVNGTREGWRSFDEEYPLYSSRFRRTGITPCGDDLMLM